MVRVGGVVEAGTFIDMGPVEINPNPTSAQRMSSVIGVGGETATSYLPSMRLMAANLHRINLSASSPIECRCWSARTRRSSWRRPTPR